jgi:hypothetical protein
VLIGQEVFYGSAPSAPTGPVQIVLDRMKTHPWNGIEVTSQAMGELDPADHDQGLMWIVYRSQSAGGPFEEFNKFFRHYIYADTPLFQPTKDLVEPRDGSFRIGKDKYVMADYITPVHDADHLPHKPFYYQVGQTPVRGRDHPEPVGKEVLSNVAGPSGEAMIQIGAEKNPDGSYKLMAGLEGLAGFGVTLSMTNQVFDAVKPHVVVSYGGWRGHFFGYAGVPLSPQGGSISVHAEGDGLAASTSFTVPADPAADAQLRKQAESDAQSRDRNLKDQAVRTQVDKKAMDEAQKRAVKPASNEFNELWPQLARQYAAMRYTYRVDVEFERPRLENLFQRQIARSTRDFRAIIACDERDLALIPVLDSISDERRSALKEVYQTVAGTVITVVGNPNAADALKKLKEQTLKDVQAEIDAKYAQIAIDLNGTYADMANAAFLAGDAATFERTITERAKLPANEIAKAGGLDAIYYGAADRLVILTGDRNRGADLVRKSEEIRLAATPSERREDLRKSLERVRPAWWPEETPAKP